MPSSPFPSHSSPHSPDADHTVAFGRRLKALRKQGGLTRKELAARAGMSPHHLNKVERGASGPSFGAIHALAVGLGVDPGLFFAETDNADLSVAGPEPHAPTTSSLSWPESVPRIALLGLDRYSAGRVILSPSLSTLLGLDGSRQALSLGAFLERHVMPADRIALKLDLENLAAGIPVRAREVRLLPTSGSRIVAVLQGGDGFLEQIALDDEGLAEGFPKAGMVWLTVVDVTHLDALLRDHSASQVGQIFQLEELIRDRERCSHALEQESHVRRQAERMMLDAQRLLQGVVHSARDALIILGPDLSVLDGNSAFRQLCLGECDPSRTCHLHDSVDKKTLRRVKELISQAVSSKCLAQGDVFINDQILELGLFPLFDTADKPLRFVLWLRDATRTSQQREELRKQRMVLEKAEQMARMGSWEWDMEADVFRMSPNWFAIHGSRPRVLTAAELFPLAHPHDLPAIQDSLQKVLDGEPEYRIEHRIIRQDTGDVRWVSSMGEVVRDETSRPVKLYGVCHDVTDLRENQRHLADQHRRLEQMAERALAGYWDWNIQEDTAYLSPMLKKLFGYEDHELDNKPQTWKSLIFPEDLLLAMQAFADHVTSRGTRPYNITVRYRHRDGSTVRVICTGTVVDWDEHGNPLRMIGCHVDVTGEAEAISPGRLSSSANLPKHRHQAASPGTPPHSRDQGTIP